MVSYLRTFRLFSRDIRLFLLSTFFIGFGFIGIQGVLFNLYLVRLGFGTEQIGLVLGIGQIAHAALCLPAGALGARWGNRRLLILGALVSALGLGLVPMAELIPPPVQLVWIAVAHVCVWTGATFYIVNAGPFVMAACEPEVRAHVFAVRAAMSPIAGVSGSLFAGWLPGVLIHYAGMTDNPSVYGYPLLVATASLGVGALLQASAKWRDNPVSRTETVAPVASQAPYTVIAFMSLIALLRAMGEGSGRSFFNVYLDTVLLAPTAAIGALIAAGQVLSIPVSLAMPPLVQRWGLERTMRIGLWGASLSLLSMALLSHATAASLGYMSLVTWYSLNQPLFVMYAQGAVPRYWRTSISGAMTMATAVGIAVVSMVGGRLIAAQGYSSLWLWASGLAACGALVLAAYQRFARTRSATMTPQV